MLRREGLALLLAIDIRSYRKIRCCWSASLQSNAVFAPLFFD